MTPMTYPQPERDQVVHLLLPIGWHEEIAILKRRLSIRHEQRTNGGSTVVGVGREARVRTGFSPQDPVEEQRAERSLSSNQT